MRTGPIFERCLHIDKSHWFCFSLSRKKQHTVKTFILIQYLINQVHFPLAYLSKLENRSNSFCSGVKRETSYYKNLRWGRDSQGVWDGHVYTAVFKMDSQQGPTLQHMEFCSMSLGSVNGRGVWGRMVTCIRMAESLRCSPKTIHNIVNWLYFNTKC